MSLGPSQQPPLLCSLGLCSSFATLRRLFRRTTTPPALHAPRQQLAAPSQRPQPAVRRLGGTPAVPSHRHGGSPRGALATLGIPWQLMTVTLPSATRATAATGYFWTRTRFITCDTCDLALCPACFGRPTWLTPSSHLGLHRRQTPAGQAACTKVVAHCFGSSIIGTVARPGPGDTMSVPDFQRSLLQRSSNLRQLSRDYLHCDTISEYRRFMDSLPHEDGSRRTGAHMVLSRLVMNLMMASS